MVNFFDYLYYLVFDKKGLVFSLARFLIRSIANICIPIYYRASLNKYRLDNSQNSGFVISMTSFPARVNTLWLVIESLMRQTVKPEKIYLWLSKEQFGSLDVLPKSLLKMRSKGLEIILRDGDLRSHKKYVYALRELEGKDFIIVDDDVFYNTKTLEKIVKLHKQYPQTICCNLGDRILDSSGAVMKYKYWKIEKPEVNCQRKYILPIGVGGVYYPTGSLSTLVADDGVFMQLCPKADDLWLWSMATVNNTEFACSKNKFGYLPVIIKNNITLASTNTKCQNDIDTGNDAQMKKLISFLKSNQILTLRIKS